MKIGLIADSHTSKRGELWPQVFTAFDGVDAILHAGDLWTLALIEELQTVAPTYVARGNGDLGLEHDRLQDTWSLDFDGVTVGMIHEFPTPRRREPAFITERARKIFTESPDVLIYGHTHMEEVHDVDGLLCVNPGSPTLPRNKSLRLGTIGFLEIEAGAVDVSLWQLTEDGIIPAVDQRSPGFVPDVRAAQPRK